MKMQTVLNLFVIVAIVLISEVAISRENTRSDYLSKIGISPGSIQSIQNVETKLLKDFKVSRGAERISKKVQSKKNLSRSHQTKLKLKRVASAYNKTLKKHLNPSQIAGYMGYLNGSKELIHVPGAFYSPHILGSFIKL